MNRMQIEFVQSPMPMLLHRCLHTFFCALLRVCECVCVTLPDADELNDADNSNNNNNEMIMDTVGRQGTGTRNRKRPAVIRDC